MLRFLAVAVLALGIAGPASAAVTVDPFAADPTERAGTVFTAAGTFSVAGDSFTLTNPGKVNVAVSGSGFPASISLFEITSNGSTVAKVEVPSMNIVNMGNIAFAGISDVSLGAGTYMLTVMGNFVGGNVSADISAVPVPAGVVLFGSAIAGLGLYRRARRSA